MRKDSLLVNQYLIGIDEAGRGPLAGPVAVGTSMIRDKNTQSVFKILKKAGLNDSKKVKEQQQEKIYELLLQLKKEKKIEWEVSLISAKIISTKGISKAIQIGIEKNLKKLNIKHKTEQIILEMDGALRVPHGNWKKASVIIKGDSIKPSIMIASIIAKVTRDRYMKKISKKHPEYKFEIHKGYGTQKHRDLLSEHGLSTEHRIGWYKG